MLVTKIHLLFSFQMEPPKLSIPVGTLTHRNIPQRDIDTSLSGRIMIAITLRALVLTGNMSL